jgi:ribosomal protein S18 acetylase RimI-like enzyme
LTDFGPIEPLGEQHRLEAFDSGVDSLDEWLRRRATPNQTAGFSRTYVIATDDHVVAYHSVSSFTIWRSDATGRARRQSPSQVPAVLLARLAVDRQHQGRGLGAELLRHAMELTIAAADTIGIRLLVVNAIDEQAAAFYRRFGLESSPTNPLDLMITVNDLRASRPGES